MRINPRPSPISSKGSIGTSSLAAETGLHWSAVEGLGLKIKTCTLWAAACTTGLFDNTYLPAIQSGQIGKFALFNLKDCPECDDHCAHIYNKSLLYLVSNSFEKKLRPPLKRHGEPILGMDKFVTQHRVLQQLIEQGKVDYVLAPNEAVVGTPVASTASHHGDFDDDGPTVKATLARILGRDKIVADFTFAGSAAAMRDRRKALGE